MLELKKSEEELDLERQAEELIVGQTPEELAGLKKEIESSLAADRSFALEIRYWSSVLKKIDETTAQATIERIYREHVVANKTSIEAEVQQAKSR